MSLPFPESPRHLHLTLSLLWTLKGYHPEQKDNRHPRSLGAQPCPIHQGAQLPKMRPGTGQGLVWTPDPGRISSRALSLRPGSQQVAERN